jgi:hypothetical protein
MRLKLALAMTVLAGPVLAQPAPATIKQDDALVAIYQQTSDAFAMGRRVLGICQENNAEISRQLAAARQELEELKKLAKAPSK